MEPSETKPICSSRTHARPEHRAAGLAAALLVTLAVGGCSRAFASGAIGTAGAAPGPVAPTKREPVQSVDPRIGTVGGNGGTLPVVTRPFGMTQWTAVTRDDRISVSPYSYDGTYIRGFLGTHKPAIWMGDYGYVQLMPGVGPHINPALELPFTHARETSSPYFYAVDLNAPQGVIRAELAATERAGFLRFNFPAGQAPYVVLEAIHTRHCEFDKSPDKDGGVHVDPDARELTGYNPDSHSAGLGPPLANFKGYFVVRFDRPFASFGTWEAPGHLAPRRTDATGQHMGAYVTFAPDSGPVSARVGTSFISLEQARANLASEMPGWSFEAVRDGGRQAWNELLGRVELEGATETQRTIFYTAMYHALLFPRIFSEGGRYYSAFDDKVHPGVSYNDFSLWDTFRAEHPLLTLIAPERVNGIVRALVQMQQEGGWLPLWPNPAESNIMISSHADCVIADAFVKGFRDYDVQAAYQAVRKDAFVPPVGDTGYRWPDRGPWRAYEARGGLTWYQKLGYVAQDKTNESVSRTVEFGVDDFCVAQMARELAPGDVDVLSRHSRNYKNLYNPADGLLEPKSADGSWFPIKEEGFTEETGWEYLFGAMHDPKGMIEMVGGPERFVTRLDQGFADGSYEHGNEPAQHYPYLYDYAGQPWRTQERVRDLLATRYRATPDGLAGDDDCGQMSAWYIFGALGFYPVTPASGEYALGSPLFDRVTLHLGPPYRPATLVIEAKNQGPKNVYVQQVTFNGKPLDRPFLRHQDLVAGGTLQFVMGPRARFQ